MSKEFNMAEGQALLDKLAIEDSAALIRAIAGEGPKSNGGPAFPLEGSSKRNANSGMTLRDYFAAKAMQGMIANGDWVSRMASRTGAEPSECTSSAAYEVADAMLLERAK